MRSVISICFICLGLSFASISAAQDKKAETESAKKAPSEDTTKSDKSSKEAETTDDAFDMDSFFKKGEENAKKGSSCRKAPDPIV